MKSLKHPYTPLSHPAPDPQATAPPPTTAHPTTTATPETSPSSTISSSTALPSTSQPTAVLANNTEGSYA